MNKVKEILKSQEGATLILILFLVTIIAISASAFLFNSYYSTENSVYGERKLDATLRSKGGIEEGLSYVEETYSQTGTISDHTILRGTEDWYNVEITTSGNNFSVRSTANYMTLYGTRDVIYIVNGNFSSGYGGLSSTFYKNSVVTVNPFSANNFHDISIKGDFAGDYNINNYNSFNIDGNEISPLTSAEFTNEYNNLKTQVDELYPFPYILSGTERIDSSQVFEGDLERDKIIFNNGSGVIVFNGNVYADELTIGNGDYDIVVEGTVYVKKLSINNTQGSIHIKGNVIVEGDFTINNTEMGFIVDGLILTENYLYNNDSTIYSVPYIVARDEIRINNIDDINLGGLASPNIDIVNVNDVNIDQSSGGDGSTGSYAITDWNVQF
ncbi:MAG: hypothetical protein AB7V16_03015 [Vulcanibacillus sp.]